MADSLYQLLQNAVVTCLVLASALYCAWQAAPAGLKSWTWRTLRRVPLLRRFANRRPNTGKRTGTAAACQSHCAACPVRPSHTPRT